MGEDFWYYYRIFSIIKTLSCARTSWYICVWEYFNLSDHWFVSVWEERVTVIFLFSPVHWHLLINTKEKKDVVSCATLEAAVAPGDPHVFVPKGSVKPKTSKQLVCRSVGADIIESRQWVSESAHSANNHPCPFYNQLCLRNLIAGFWVISRREQECNSITY